jgi:hypothetical protein
MTHVRKQIRDNVTTAVTGLATTGTNVFQSRVYPNEASKLPCLCVYTLTEEAEVISLTPPRIGRTLDLVVEGYAKAKTGLDDTLDAIAVEVEEALATDITRGGLAQMTAIQSTDIGLEGEGEQPIGVIKMTFQVEYVTANTDVETNV